MISTVCVVSIGQPFKYVIPGFQFLSVDIPPCKMYIVIFKCMGLTTVNSQDM